MFRDLEKVQTSFTGLAAHVSFGANLAARGQTESVDGLLVSGNYFPVVGIRPAIGRLLTPDDDRAPGESHVVVLSWGYWQRRFGLDPSILGQTDHRQRPADDGRRRAPSAGSTARRSA